MRKKDFRRSPPRNFSLGGIDLMRRRSGLKIVIKP
jgi:hypothetical protein